MTAVHSIPRHDIDAAFARKQVQALQPLINSATADVDELASVRDNALRRLRYLTALTSAQSHDETRQAAVFASQTANAVFARTCKTEDEIRYRLGDQDVTLPVLGPNHHATPVDWLTAAWLAIITGSEERIGELCDVGKYTLRGCGVKVEDYVHPWIETLQRFLSGQPVSPALLTSVIDLSDPANAKYATSEFMLLIAYPPVNILYRVMRGTATTFNESLAQALTAHRDYWSQPDLAGDPGGFVSLPVLAMAILGRANGFPIEVESGYLPKSLLR